MEHPKFSASVRVVVGTVGARMERPYTDERVGMISSALPGGRLRFILVVPTETLAEQLRGKWEGSGT